MDAEFAIKWAVSVMVPVIATLLIGYPCVVPFEVWLFARQLPINDSGSSLQSFANLSFAGSMAFAIFVGCLLLASKYKAPISFGTLAYVCDTAVLQTAGSVLAREWPPQENAARLGIAAFFYGLFLSVAVAWLAVSLFVSKDPHVRALELDLYHTRFPRGHGLETVRTS